MSYCTTWHWLDVKTRKHLWLHTLMLIILLIVDLTYIRSLVLTRVFCLYILLGSAWVFFSLSKTTIWRMKTKISYYYYSLYLFRCIVYLNECKYSDVVLLKCNQMFCKTASWTVYLIIIFCHSAARFCICFLSFSIFLIYPITICLLERFEPTCVDAIVDLNWAKRRSLQLVSEIWLAITLALWGFDSLEVGK